MQLDPASISSRLAAYIETLTTPSAGAGPSTTKLVYLSNGMAACYCAVLATVGGVAVYVFDGRADVVYWAGVASMWTATLGFAGSALKNQHQQAATVATASVGHSPASEGSP